MSEIDQAFAEVEKSFTETKPLALPVDAKQRKAIPIVAGCLDYFPAALAAVAELSRIGNEQHNPGQPLHHARGKSADHADCIVRHLMDRGTVDTDGVRHAAKVAWRSLAMLQEELEAAGAPLARGARAAPVLEITAVTFIPKHAADCKDQNCDRSCMPAKHCKACGSVTPSTCCPECRPATLKPCTSCGNPNGARCQDC